MKMITAVIMLRASMLQRAHARAAAGPARGRSPFPSSRFLPAAHAARQDLRHDGARELHQQPHRTAASRRRASPAAASGPAPRGRGRDCRPWSARGACVSVSGKRSSPSVPAMNSSAPAVTARMVKRSIIAGVPPVDEAHRGEDREDGQHQRHVDDGGLTHGGGEQQQHRHAAGTRRAVPPSAGRNCRARGRCAPGPPRW